MQQSPERVDKVDNALGEGTFPSPNRTPQSALRRGLSRSKPMHMSSVSPSKKVITYSFFNSLKQGGCQLQPPCLSQKSRCLCPSMT